MAYSIIAGAIAAIARCYSKYNTGILFFKYKCNDDYTVVKYVNHLVFNNYCKIIRKIISYYIDAKYCDRYRADYCIIKYN